MDVNFRDQNFTSILTASDNKRERKTFLQPKTLWMETFKAQKQHLSTLIKAKKPTFDCNPLLSPTQPPKMFPGA